MFIRSERSNQKNGHRKTTKLGIEQLESRLMNSIDNLESSLQLLNAPGLIASENSPAINSEEVASESGLSSTPLAASLVDLAMSELSLI